MRTRSPLFALLLVMLIALAGVAAPPAGAGRDRCAPRGSKTVEQTAQVRVFTRRRAGGLDYYACLRRSGRRPVDVGRSFEDSDESLDSRRILNVVIGGTSVAVVSSSFTDIGPEGEESEAILVADLRRGGRFYSVGIDTAARYNGFGRVILRDDGAAAWVLDVIGDYDEIDVLGPSARRPRSVAFAKGIDGRSLAFAAGGVTWMQDGSRRTASLP